MKTDINCARYLVPSICFIPRYVCLRWQFVFCLHQNWPRFLSSASWNTAILACNVTCNVSKNQVFALLLYFTDVSHMWLLMLMFSLHSVSNIHPLEGNECSTEACSTTTVSRGRCTCWTVQSRAHANKRRCKQSAKKEQIVLCLGD